MGVEMVTASSAPMTRWDSSRDDTLPVSSPRAGSNPNAAPASNWKRRASVGLSVGFALLLVAAVTVPNFTANTGTGMNGGDNLQDDVDGEVTGDWARACPNRLDKRLPRVMARQEAKLREDYEDAGEATWAEFQADPDAHAGKIINLYNADFASGTLRLTRPGLYQLKEDVTFNPNPSLDWRPDCATQPEYCGRAYTLGFFASMAVEAEDIIIDLGGFTLEQSAEHALQQRFFALIELAGAPFIPGQGPANFGDELETCETVILCNGHLGRSSHHGVHGNSGARVYIHDITLKDYEVAALHLNGFSSVVVENTHAQGSRTDIPVIGTYSNGRFLMPFLDQAIAESNRASLIDARAALQAVMDTAFDDIINNGGVIDDANTEAAHLFKNVGGKVDGNGYGFVFNKVGVAVGAFADVTNHVGNIAIIDCTITATEGDIVEVVALTTPEGALIRGPAGDVLRMTSNDGNFPDLFGGGGTYVGNALSDAQIELMEYVLTLDSEAQAAYGTISKNSRVVDWKAGSVTLVELVEDEGWSWTRNGDTMFHVNKGMLGLFLAGSSDICVKDVTVSVTTNTGGLGMTDPLPGEVNGWYYGGEDGGHPDQGRQGGYMGADTYGVGITGCSDVYLENVDVQNTHSVWGLSRGLDIFNYAHDVHLHNVAISDVSSLSAVVPGESYTMAYKVGQAVGLHISQDAYNVYKEDVSVSDISAGVTPLASLTASTATDLNAQSGVSNIYEL